jgi:hypothetical protein
MNEKTENEDELNHERDIIYKARQLEINKKLSQINTKEIKYLTIKSN